MTGVVPTGRAREGAGRIHEDPGGVPFVREIPRLRRVGLVWPLLRLSILLGPVLHGLLRRLTQSRHRLFAGKSTLVFRGKLLLEKLPGGEKDLFDDDEDGENVRQPLSTAGSYPVAKHTEAASEAKV